MEDDIDITDIKYTFDDLLLYWKKYSVEFHYSIVQKTRFEQSLGFISEDVESIGKDNIYFSHYGSMWHISIIDETLKRSDVPKVSSLSIPKVSSLSIPKVSPLSISHLYFAEKEITVEYDDGSITFLYEHYYTHTEQWQTVYLYNHHCEKYPRDLQLEGDYTDKFNPTDQDKIDIPLWISNNAFGRRLHALQFWIESQKHR
jgi:hypothetical protein